MQNSSDHNTIFKEICYKFESLKFDVFADSSSDVITLSVNQCNTCFRKWHQEYNQCVFCGSVFYYVFSCEDNGHISSITSNKQICQNKIFDELGRPVMVEKLDKSGNVKTDAKGNIQYVQKVCGSKGIKKCINPSCSSNSDQDISNFVNKIKNKGMFDSKSPFYVSQMWCLNCGNNLSNFFAREVKIIIKDSIDDTNWIGENLYDIYVINLEKNKFLTLTYEEIKVSNIKDRSLYSNNIDIDKIRKLKFTS